MSKWRNCKGLWCTIFIKYYFMSGIKCSCQFLAITIVAESDKLVGWVFLTIWRFARIPQSLDYLLPSLDYPFRIYRLFARVLMPYRSRRSIFLSLFSSGHASFLLIASSFSLVLLFSSFPVSLSCTVEISGDNPSFAADFLTQIPSRRCQFLSSLHNQQTAIDLGYFFFEN